MEANDTLDKTIKIINSLISEDDISLEITLEDPDSGNQNVKYRENSKITGHLFSLIHQINVLNSQYEVEHKKQDDTITSLTSSNLNVYNKSLDVLEIQSNQNSLEIIGNTQPNINFSSKQDSISSLVTVARLPVKKSIEFCSFFKDDKVVYGGNYEFSFLNFDKIKNDFSYYKKNQMKNIESRRNYVEIRHNVFVISDDNFGYLITIYTFDEERKKMIKQHEFEMDYCYCRFVVPVDQSIFCTNIFEGHILVFNSMKPYNEIATLKGHNYEIGGMIKLSNKNILISVEIEKSHRKIILDEYASGKFTYKGWTTQVKPILQRYENYTQPSKLIFWDLNSYQSVHTMEDIGVISNHGLLELPNGNVAVAGNSNLKIIDVDNYTVVKEISFEEKELKFNEVKLIMFYNVLVFFYFTDIYQISGDNYEIIQVNNIVNFPDIERKTFEISKDFKYAIALEKNDENTNLLLLLINYFENIGSI